MRGAERTFTGPDALSVARIPLACALVAVAPHRGATLSIFIVGCATDVIDGWWARRKGTTSERGAHLDSVADAVFFAAAAFVVLSTVEFRFGVALAVGVGLVAATRVASLVVTKRRFGRWSIMHTDLNRVSGAALAIATACAISQGRLSLSVLLAVTALAQLAATEELVMVSAAHSYNPDRRGRLREAIARVIR